MSAEKVRTICFKIEGEWFTQHCRTLWADEDQPQKALAMLDCLVGDSDGQEMNEEIALRILTGRAKLIGNSTDGIYLKEDRVNFSEHGNALSLQARFRRLGFKAQESTFEIMCRNQIKAKRTKYVASPFGGVHLPLCAWEKIKTGEWDWKELEPYIHGGDFPQTEKALERMQSLYRYKDDDDIEDNCERIIAQREVREASDKKTEEAAKNHIIDMARAGFTNLNIDETIVDKFIREQLEVETNAGMPIPSKDLEAQNGWIAPNGDFFTCGMIQHNALAERMGFNTKILEQTHVRISTNTMSEYRSPLQFEGRNLTQKQKDKIWDWCEHHKVDVPPWVFGDKGTKFSKERS